MKYRNPVLYADYSDPDAVRVGNDYYMTASSFSNVPGLPVLHSKNLVSWELAGYALEQIPEFRYRDPVHGCGVWAPAIRYHAGRFYIFFPMPDEGIYAVSAERPEGPWEKPVKLYDGAGLIDPCPLWDGDKAYMVCAVAGSRRGYRNVLYMFDMDPVSLKLSGPVKVYEGGDENPVTEGPKLYKKDGFYWIFAPAGGVKTGWQLAMRSRDIYGPYEVRTVMRQGKSGVNGPHQGAWVTDTEGGDWFLHFQDVFAAGRIVHLQPMKWQEGWPVIGRDTGLGYGEPVTEWESPPGQEIRPGKEDLVTNGRLSLKLQWNANPGNDFYSIKDGRLKLNAAGFDKRRPLTDLPNLLLMKWEAPEFTEKFLMDAEELAEGDEAGIISLGTESIALSALRTDGGLVIRSVKDVQNFDRGNVYTDEEVCEICTVPSGIIEWRVTVTEISGVTAMSPKPETGYGHEAEVLHPAEEVRLSAVCNGREVACVTAPARAGRWVGCKYGVFCADRSSGEKKEKGSGAYFCKC